MISLIPPTMNFVYFILLIVRNTLLVIIFLIYVRTKVLFAVWVVVYF